MKKLLVAVSLFASLNAALSPEMQAEKIENAIKSKFEGQEVVITAEDNRYVVEAENGEQYVAVVEYLPNGNNCGPQQFEITVQEK